MRRRGDLSFRILRALVKPGDIVFDIGASTGVYTFELARLVRPSGRLDAIEPYPPTWQALDACNSPPGSFSKPSEWSGCETRLESPQSFRRRRPPFMADCPRPPAGRRTRPVAGNRAAFFAQHLRSDQRRRANDFERR
jgi:hypothetical protein